MRGRTHLDELAYSLNGENKHYGTPRNPACPDRIPGGSSSGSVVAVASGDVDFSVGSDTGGRVHNPLQDPEYPSTPDNKLPKTHIVIDLAAGAE